MLSISPACHGQLVRMLTSNEPYDTFVCLDQIAYSLFRYGPATDMQSCDEAAWKIKNAEICLKSQYLFLTTITGQYFKDWLSKFARPTGVHYYHCVSPSIRSICFHTFAGT